MSIAKVLLPRGLVNWFTIRAFLDLLDMYVFFFVLFFVFYFSFLEQNMGVVSISWLSFSLLLQISDDGTIFPNLTLVGDQFQVRLYLKAS